MASEALNPVSDPRQFRGDKITFIRAKGLMAGVFRVFAVIVNRVIPTAGRVKEPAYAGLAEFSEKPLHNHIQVAE